MKKTLYSQLQLWYEKNKEAVYKDYFKFLEFQSVSTDPSYSPHVLSCADWVVAYLEQLNLETRKIDTPNYPVIFAKTPTKENAHTILMYGHYDVQPIDPIELWDTDPFEPVIKNNNVFARGASDDKGQIFYAIIAIKALLEITKDLPINVKFCIEGEEESGSLGLTKILEKEKDTFACDSLLIVDVGTPDVNTPAITLGARGLVQMEIELTNGKSDLHSGVHGGITYSVNRAMTELLSKFWDKDHRIQVPGIYDDVAPIPKKDFDTELDLKEYQKVFEINATAIEKGVDPLQANWFLPSVEINGMSGGYSGKGMKTVIPAKASAKISCRLVANQSPEKVVQQIKNFLINNTPAGIDIKIKDYPGSFPIIGNIHSQVAKAAIKAYTEIYNKPCKRIITGSSIPVVWDMMQILNCEMILVGVGIVGDNIHAPNEHFGLDRFEKGFYMIALLIENLSNE